MSVYDTFMSQDGKTDVQLKIQRNFNTYNINDKVSDIPDGVYVGYDGVVVIINSIFVALFPNIIDKWGGIHEPSKLLDTGERVP